MIIFILVVLAIFCLFLLRFLNRLDGHGDAIGNAEDCLGRQARCIGEQEAAIKEMEEIAIEQYAIDDKIRASTTKRIDAQLDSLNEQVAVNDEAMLVALRRVTAGLLEKIDATNARLTMQTTRIDLHAKVAAESNFANRKLHTEMADGNYNELSARLVVVEAFLGRYSKAVDEADSDAREASRINSLKELTDKIFPQPEIHLKDIGKINGVRIQVPVFAPSKCVYVGPRVPADACEIEGSDEA